jgi:hypothetical protein
LALSDIIKTSLGYRSQIVTFRYGHFTISFRETKNPASIAVSRVREKFDFASSEPAYTKIIQIAFGAFPNSCHG